VPNSGWKHLKCEETTASIYTGNEVCPTLTQEQIRTVHLRAIRGTLRIVWRHHVMSHIEIGQETQIYIYACK